MGLWTSLSAGLRGLFRKRDAEQELDDELRDFLDKSTAEKMSAGMTREQAHRAARFEVGGVEAVKEEVRSVSWETHLETIWNDLRFGARLLRFNPVFAGAAILSLALGIGANTAIFQVLDAVRLRTLPVRNPQEIARIAFDRRGSRSGNFSTRYPDFSYAIWQQIRERQEGFSSVYAWAPTQFNVSPAGEVHSVQGLWVSGEFFETLGVGPEIGRLLSVADDQPTCATAGAVLSYSYWQEQYGGRADTIGGTVSINRHLFPIVGVAASDFYGVEVGRSFDVAVPICAEPLVNGEDSHLKSRVDWWLSVMGRLKPGWTVERAAAQLRAVSPTIFEATLPPQYNPSNVRHFLEAKLTAIPGSSGVSELRKTYEQPLWLLLGLAGLVLLIASANLANLLLARASAREKEMGMRMAVGAGRGRLIRQLLAESLLLALIGTLLGAFLAHGLSQVLVASLSTQQDPLFVNLATDWRLFGFTTALAVVTCLLFGLAPALRATSVAPGLILKESARGLTEGRSRFGLRRVLVVTQIALSLTLLVGAVLFARSLNNLAKLDPGFRRDGILVADIDFSARHLTTEARKAFSEELLRRVRAIPGVDAAAIAAIVPLSGDGIGHDILPGETGEPESEAPVAAFNYVSRGFFDTLQTPFLMGRDFDEHDRMGAPNVAVVNEAFVKRYARGKNPVELRFRVRRMMKTSAPYQIIGVVKDTKYSDLREDLGPIVYIAQAQNDDAASDAQILLRSRAPLAGLLAAVKSSAIEADPDADITFYNLHKMIDDGLLRDRLMARLSGFFGFLAVLLAVIGLYGVISYMVARRRNEIGIRMSLGADRRSIIALVLRESVLLLCIGLTIGVVVSLAASSAAASLLFGLNPHDATTLVIATASLAAIALTASYLPALRASRLDPIEALRHE
ncbi:MAG TPA: ABC transporter permease [Candidatus Acidoferrum sp.]|jgi:predicted permease